jgi:hypothetical protein
MMDLISWWNSKIKTLNCYDLGFIKLSAFLFALLLAKLYMPLISLDWYWYAILFVLAAIPPVAKILKSR